MKRSFVLGAWLAAHAACGDKYAIPCEQSVEPRFVSIERQLLHRSCGTAGGSCHSTAGAEYSGMLDLEHGAYANLLGDSGSGAPAANIEGTTQGLLRVKPGDPDASFLMIKMTLATRRDP